MPEMAFIMGGGPHTSTRLSSDGGGICCFSTSAVMWPVPARSSAGDCLRVQLGWPTSQRAVFQQVGQF